MRIHQEVADLGSPAGVIRAGGRERSTAAVRAASSGPKLTARYRHCSGQIGP
jgi:hypothetical protein